VFKLGTHLIRSRVDVVHLTGMLLGGTGKAAVLECWMYKLLSKRFFLTVHNIQPHDRESYEKKTELVRLYAIPHTLVVHTDRMRQILIDEYAVSAGRVVVMHHGVDEIPEVVFNPSPPAIEFFFWRVLLQGD